MAQAKAALRESNAAPKRPGARTLTHSRRAPRKRTRLTPPPPSRADEATLKLRDSSIKRNTALMKKLRAVTDDGRDALLRDLRAVNLSKYVTEAAAALAEGRHKAGDVWAAVEVASELHRTYAEFGGLLGPALAKLVPAAGAATGGEGGEALPPLQRRLKLRLLTELILVVRAPSRVCACARA